MDRALRPSRLDTLPNTPSATKLFKHWLRTFEYYLDELPQELNKLKILTNFVVFDVYEIISECPNYEAAIQALQSVSAIEYRDEYIRDAFITGINSQIVRQRLLENSTISLDEIFSKARTLKSAQKNAENYLQYNTSNTTVAAIASNCWNCGNQRHAKAVCPAREWICFKCEKVGHFAKLCKSFKRTTAGINLVDQPLNSYNPSLT
nr:uncharacterized protein LOC101237398 [Hydra vulgaris]